jgi:hypothetical protein
VGRLSREGSEYVFTYTQGARSAEAAGFRPLSSFPDFDQVYVSRELFPMFQNRLPPQSRPDYEDFVEWLDLERGEADPLVMLARSGGQRETDMFEELGRHSEAQEALQLVSQRDPESDAARAAARQG